MKKVFFILWAFFAFGACGGLSSESSSGFDGLTLVTGIIIGGLLATLIFLIGALFYRLISDPKEVLTGRSSSKNVKRSSHKKTPNDDGYTIVRAVKFIFIAAISFPLVCCIFSDELHESYGRVKASPQTLLDVKKPPRVYEKISATKEEELPHYKNIYDLYKYVTLFNDESYDRLFLINSNFVFEFREPEKQELILLGKNQGRLYGFQLNIFDPSITKQMTLEKAVILAGRYVPTHVVSGVRSETYYDDADWATFYCLETKGGFKLLITSLKDGNWVIFGGPRHQYCRKTKNSLPWKMNFDELFARGNENLFVEEKSK